MVSLPNLIVLLAISGVIYLASLAVYRLYFSPIAKFPGPKLAAVTLWYEFYYDVVKRGRYQWKIGELHKKYGPIIRINPYELHINDPDYYDEVYVNAGQRRTMKYEWAYRAFGPTVASFSTESHELHRIRRGSIAPFFSKGSVVQFEPTVRVVIDKFISRLEGLKGAGIPVNLIDAFSALTNDIIGQYAFASPLNFLDTPDFSPWWNKCMLDVLETAHLFKQFPWMEPLTRKLPPWFIEATNPRLGSLLNLARIFREKIAEVQNQLAHGKTMEKTIFADILTNPNLSAADKTIERLEQEAISVTTAGSNTTAHTLSTITFHLASNKSMLDRLQQELGTVLSKPDAQVTWSQLEKLPYLTAVVTEGLRRSYGVTSRLQRISPDIALRYDKWIIPVGTPVGMSTMLMHNNEDAFPNPLAFDPERWLQPDSTRLRNYLTPFCRGSRQCLGINLAYCELYLTLAAIFAPGRFHWEPFETTIEDVETEHDFFTPFPKVGAEGLRGMRMLVK